MYCSQGVRSDFISELCSLRSSTDIPYFKEVVIMSTNCDKCGHRDNEVKSSGGIEEKGHKMELEIKSSLDMARDVLKKMGTMRMLRTVKALALMWTHRVYKKSYEPTL